MKHYAEDTKHMVTYKGEQEYCILRAGIWYRYQFLPERLLQLGVIPKVGEAFCHLGQEEDAREPNVLNIKI